jgi:predicted nuclease with RNAse H fold
MRTLGIDLASQPKKTAVCCIVWNSDAATVTTLKLGATDTVICNLAEESDVVGIDAPFGWPQPFMELLSDQLLGSGDHVAWTGERRDSLRLRLTDFRVRDVSGLWPLSVSSDRIAVAAMRCAGLLYTLGVHDRSGDDRVFEVYPAAALTVWGFVARGYKVRGIQTGPARDQLATLVSLVLQACPWLTMSEEIRALCCQSDDAFDALIASFIARAAGIGATLRPTTEEHRRARIEGWIAIPESNCLSRLAVG